MTFEKYAVTRKVVEPWVEENCTTVGATEDTDALIDLLKTYP